MYVGVRLCRRADCLSALCLLFCVWAPGQHPRGQRVGGYRMVHDMSRYVSGMRSGLGYGTQGTTDML